MPTERIQPKQNAVNSPRTPQSPWNPTCITDNNGTSSSRSSYESHVKWRGIKSHQFHRKGSQVPFAWSLCRDYLKVFHFNCYLIDRRGTKRKEIIFFFAYVKFARGFLEGVSVVKEDGNLTDYRGGLSIVFFRFLCRHILSSRFEKA